jgi:hypothetical protein
MDMYFPDMLQISCTLMVSLNVYCRFPPTYKVNAITFTKNGARRYIAFYFMDTAWILLKIKLQLQDWNLERKDLESRRQIGEFENGNAEE